MEPKRPRRRPAPRSGRSIWRTLNSRPDGCAPTSASFTIPAIPNPGSLPCPNGRATCAPWTTARGGASSQCSRTSNRAVSALRTPRSASLTAWIASSWSWPSPSTGRSPQDSGMPSTMPLPAKKKRSRSTQESGPQPNLLVHQGPPPHRQDRPILPAAPAPLGGAAKLMDGKIRELRDCWRSAGEHSGIRPTIFEDASVEPSSSVPTIQAGQLIRTPDSVITASGSAAGNIVIAAPNTDISSSLVVLSETFVDASSQLRVACAAHGGRPTSSFAAGGRGGLPPDPGAPLATSLFVQ